MTDPVGRWQLAVMTCSNMVGMLDMLDLPALIAEGDRADAIGPIVDPTMYRDKMVAFHQDMEVLRAANTFVQTMKAAVEKAERRGELPGRAA